MTNSTIAYDPAPTLEQGSDPAPSGTSEHGKKRGPGPRARIRSLLKHLALILTGGVMIYPLLWMVASSLRPDDIIFREPGILLQTLETANYSDGWGALSSPFSVYLFNSAVVVLGCIVGNLVSCSMAAYAFARLEFRFKKPAFALMLLTIMLPFHVVIVPQYIMFSQIGWVNTFWPLIVPKLLATDAFFVFLMVQFIRGIPKDMDEAARIDGAGHARIFGQIILPMMVPALATTTIFTFIWTWNDFLGPLLYVNSPEKYPLPIALRLYNDATSTSDYGATVAVSFLALLPILIFFIVFQRFLVDGVATQGLKG